MPTPDARAQPAPVAVSWLGHPDTTGFQATQPACKQSTIGSPMRSSAKMVGRRLSAAQKWPRREATWIERKG